MDTSRHHYLKTETEYFQAIEKGIKSFEVRKNDRDYQVHDILHLEETINGIKTGRVLSPRVVRYILHGPKYGIEAGYCVMQLKSV